MLWQPALSSLQARTGARLRDLSPRNLRTPSGPACQLRREPPEPRCPSAGAAAAAAEIPRCDARREPRSLHLMAESRSMAAAPLSAAVLSRRADYKPLAQSWAGRQQVGLCLGAGQIWARGRRWHPPAAGRAACLPPLGPAGSALDDGDGTQAHGLARDAGGVAGVDHGIDVLQRRGESGGQLRVRGKAKRLVRQQSTTASASCLNEGQVGQVWAGQAGRRVRANCGWAALAAAPLQSQQPVRSAAQPSSPAAQQLRIMNVPPGRPPCSSRAPPRPPGGAWPLAPRCRGAAAGAAPPAHGQRVVQGQRRQLCSSQLSMPRRQRWRVHCSALLPIMPGESQLHVMHHRAPSPPWSRASSRRGCGSWHAPRRGTCCQTSPAGGAQAEPPEGSFTAGGRHRRRAAQDQRRPCKAAVQGWQPAHAGGPAGLQAGSTLASMAVWVPVSM